MGLISASTPWGRIRIDAPDDMPLSERAKVLRDLANVDDAIAAGKYKETHPPQTGKVKVDLATPPRESGNGG